MNLYSVYVARSWCVQVDVEADSPQAAEEIVGRCDFALPGLERWSGQKDWIIEAEEVETWQ